MALQFETPREVQGVPDGAGTVCLPVQCVYERKGGQILQTRGSLGTGPVASQTVPDERELRFEFDLAPWGLGVMLRETLRSRDLKMDPPCSPGVELEAARLPRA